MKRKGLIIALFILVLLLAAELAFMVSYAVKSQKAPAPAAVAAEPQPETTESVPETTETTAPETTEVPETEETTEATEPETTEIPETTEAPTEAPTEPQPEHFTLTFVGDCTLGSTNALYGTMYSYIWTIGEDYDYPFANVRKYFENDDFTIANLEGNLMDEVMYSDSQFSFRGPTAYTQILTGSSVEMVTLANNHTMDFGKKGYDLTTDALTAANMSFVEKDSSTMFTTESGLTIGVYGCAFTVNGAHARSEFQRMRNAGADIIIVAVHWGIEGAYHPNNGQISCAHDLIDYGADIVYGSHPHVLQPVEEYKDGIIYYSLSNFSFGGNHWPPDLDSAVIQQEVVRELDGSVHLGETTIIPCSISSVKGTMQNNFQPTPYEEGTDAYKRALSKADGSYTGGNLEVKY